jgi:hypothetical protein
MSEADLHLKDLLSFYVEECHKELLSVVDDPVQVESMLGAIKRTREIILMMSCMIGAVTPGDIEAIRKISQIRLVAENESSHMLRVGEDMALLRIWLKSAADPQWNITDAIRLFRTGRPSPASCFPEMTGDILRSVKKPFVVPSTLPRGSEELRRVLRTWVFTQFQQAKREPPYVPARISLQYNDEDDSVTVSSPNEFYFRGIYDSRRWTIIEAQILDDEAGKANCRQILQALANSTLSEMISAVLRMATAQKLKKFQDEAIALSNAAWSSVSTVAKLKAGIGNGFTVSIFKKLSVEMKISFEMDFSNGELLVKLDRNSTDDIPIEVQGPFDEFGPIIQSVEHQVRKWYLGSIIAQAVEISDGQLICEDRVVFFPESQIMISINASGRLTLKSTFTHLIDPVVVSDLSRLKTSFDLFHFACKLDCWIKMKNQPILAAGSNNPGLDISIAAQGNWNEFLSKIPSIAEAVLVCKLGSEDAVLSYRDLLTVA